MVKIQPIVKSIPLDTILQYDEYSLLFNIKHIKLEVIITIKHYDDSNLSFISIKFFDIMYSTVITRELEGTTLDRLESIVYELIGKYFGIYEGSKPRDLEYFKFEDREDRTLLESILGMDNL